jgi:drug/metabolite transporter (DMT)-like permease
MQTVRAFSFTHPFTLAVLAAILGGAMPLVVSTGVETLPPILFCCLRFFISTLSLTPFLFIDARPRTSGTNWIWLAVAVLGGVANITLFAFAIPHVGLTVSQLLYLLGPCVVAAFSYWFLREPLGMRQGIGIGIGLIGTAIAISQDIKIAVTLKGIGLIAIAIVSHALFVVIGRKVRGSFSPAYQTFSMSLAGAVLLSIAHLAFEPRVAPAAIIADLFPLLYVGVIGGSVYYVLQQRIAHSASAIAVSAIVYLQPVITFFWSWLIRGEDLTASLVIGGALAMIGAFLSSQQPSPLPKANPSPRG